MDVVQVAKSARTYLAGSKLNDVIELGLPEYKDAHWYVSLYFKTEYVGAVVFTGEGKVKAQETTTIRELREAIYG